MRDSEEYEGNGYEEDNSDRGMSNEKENCRVKEEESVDEEWGDYDSEGFIDRRSAPPKGSRFRRPKDGMMMKWSDRNSEEEERPRKSRSRHNLNRERGTTSKKKSSSRPRLYTITCGRGGVQLTGLYRAE